MTAVLPLVLAVIAIFSFTACAQEVAYAYGDSGGRPLESGNITQYNGSDIVTSVIASAGPGSRSFPSKSTKTVEEIKREINLKLNIPNPTVEDKGSNLVLDYPGDRTIGQTCSIYNYMAGNWSYKADTRGIEVFQYSNKSLENGEGRYSGQGDCDDFSILMASLIESIGGTSRIVLAYGPDGGHAYTEVYLGKVGSSESDVQRMIAWLRKNYNVKEINTHTDLKTGDVWLNLDWWKEPGGAKHPGGPFFKATSQVPIPIRENTTLAPLMPMNDLPEVQFTISPSPPIVGENASFDASKSRDIGGKIDSYLWDFGDGNKTAKMSEPTVNHIYLKGGPCTVILTVEDDEGATNISSQNIMINNPPQANFTIEPQRPKVGDQVRFDASASWDAEDGKKLAYHWEINNNSAIFSVVSPPKQVYDEKGLFWINLTVTDKNGAKGYKNLLLKINQLPIPRIAFDRAKLSLGKMINFSAVASEDLDGEIVSYAWDFGDKSAVDYNKTVLHSYREGGKKTVRLSVRDNDGAISSISQEIIINRPPIAGFSFSPEKPKKGESVSFDASASSDPDGKIQRYLWDFGVGKAELEVYYSEFAEHTYNRPKNYNITLIVEDDKGVTGSFSQSIEVEEVNNKPVIISIQPDKQSPQEAGPADFSLPDSMGAASSNQQPTLIALQSDKSSPQEVGSSIKWTARAEDPENDPMSFVFRLRGPSTGDVWKPVNSDPSDNTWKWDTNSGDAGNYQISVSVRDEMHAGPQFTPDEKIVDFLLTAPQALPEVQAQPIVELLPVVTAPEQTYVPPAEEQPSQTQPLAQPQENKPNEKPVISELSANKASPQETGSTITWTVEFMDAENDPLQFQFSLDGQVMQDWSESSVWSWTATKEQVGQHAIEARVRDATHNPEGDSSKSADFEICLPPNNAPVMTSLTANKESPQVTGTVVTWAAIASDVEADPLQFQFSLDRQVMQDWSESPVWSWTATKEQVGVHAIEAKVRDGKHNPEGDSASSANFEIVLPPNNAPVLSSLTADKESPQLLGTTVTWTAQASDPESDPIGYRFLVNGTPATDWQSERLWSWTAMQPGTSQISVQVKDSQHEGLLGVGTFYLII